MLALLRETPCVSSDHTSCSACFLPQGYLPANVDRRPATLQRKQKEYFAFVEHYYDSRNDDAHQDTYRQVGAPCSLHAAPGVL